MPTLRCSICALNWPVDDDFKKCAQCLESTDRIGNVKAMPEDEARLLKAEFDFERFYEEWDESHPAERLTPGEDEARFDVAEAG